jgi:hypothetical protein
MNEGTDARETPAVTADDWLEQALRADGREQRDAYLADDGFTARVAAALPPPATLPAWRRPAVAALWTAAAAGVVLSLPVAATDVLGELVHAIGSQPIRLSGIATGVAILCAATWGAAALALRRSL